MLADFWLNNFHFALEFFGAVVLFALSWLAFDAFLIKKEMKTFLKGLGFLLFAGWNVVNSLGVKSDIWLTVFLFAYLLGLFFILLNLWLEKPPKKPVFEAIIVLPAISGILLSVHIAATFLLALIAVLAIKRYKGEELKSLKPLFLAFIFLAISSILTVIGLRAEEIIPLWISEHILKAIGFTFLTVWGWQHLKARIKEEMLLIFVGMALFISIIVTLTFSAILLDNMEGEAEVNLISNVRALEYSFSRMKSEALSGARFISENKEMVSALSENNFSALEEVSQKLMNEASLDFLTIADKEGEVVLRAHALTVKGDNVSQEKAASQALAGISYVTIEPTQTEKLSIRGAAPVYDSKDNLVGIVIGGFIVDNAFADRMKKITGLETAVYKGDSLVATTILGPDLKTRNVGAKQTDSKVIEQVLGKGEGMTGRTTIFSRPYLAAFLPLKNSEGKVIGMLEASRLQTGIIETANSASRLTLLVTIIIIIMALMPAYLLAKKLTEEI